MDSPEQYTLVLNALMEIKRDTGASNAKLDSLTKAFDAHVADDKATAAKVDELVGAHNRTKGASGAIAAVVSVLISAAGLYFGRH